MYHCVGLKQTLNNVSLSFGLGREDNKSFDFYFGLNQKYFTNIY